MINKKQDKAQKPKLIFRIIRIIIIVLFIAFLYFELSLFFITKKIVKESYNSYGEQIPQSLADNIDPVLFKRVNYRQKTQKYIASETTKVHISFIDYRITEATVHYKYTYALYDIYNEPITDCIGVCKIKYKLINGKWKAVEHNEEP